MSTVINSGINSLLYSPVIHKMYTSPMTSLRWMHGGLTTFILWLSVMLCQPNTSFTDFNVEKQLKPL